MLKHRDEWTEFPDEKALAAKALTDSSLQKPRAPF